MSILTTVFANTRWISLDIARIERRFIEWRLEEESYT